MTHEIQPIEIQSSGGAFSTDPHGLLQHFLPGAKLLKGSTRIFEGHVAGDPNKKCYVQIEALVGMLMEAKEKHINPISGMYLIPSNAPHKPASHKIKYTEGLVRANNLAGFLGTNSGLMVQRGADLIDTFGDVVLPGDTVIGAWAELYIANSPRPLRKEISKAEFWGVGKQWEKKGNWMLIKVALDHLTKGYNALHTKAPDSTELALEADPLPELIEQERAEDLEEDYIPQIEAPKPKPEELRRQQGVWARLRDAHVPEEELRDFMESQSIASTKSLTENEYRLIKDWIESYTPEPGSEG